MATVTALAGSGALTALWIAALGIVGLLIRQVVPWRKQRDDAEAKFRDGLLKREQQLTERVTRLERTLGRERLRHNAERAFDRHRLNNVTQCFDALLLLLKANPDKAGEAVKLIEDMRAKQLVAEAQEKAIIRAAEIEADDCEADHDGN